MAKIATRAEAIREPIQTRTLARPYTESFGLKTKLTASFPLVREKVAPLAF